MEIGIDEIDEIEDVYSIQEDTPQLENNVNLESTDEYLNDDTQVVDSTVSTQEDDFITEFLKTRGIEDKSKIKFLDDEGEINEVDWDSLSNDDKFNILNSSGSDSGLDDSEMELIKLIRDSKLTPSEYIQYVQRYSVDEYVKSLNQTPSYRVDDIDDDELFVYDLISRAPNITDEEARQTLESLKQNEALFTKQIEALRSEYKNLEDEQIKYSELQSQQQAQQQYDQFASGVENSILNFNEFAGCDINMDQEDMQELYDFITGFDNAGVSYLGKALNDTNTLVRMAWFALNGEKMINDINEYYKKEITNVRKESYNKGLQASKDKPKQVVHKQIQHIEPKSKFFDDLDE